MPYLIQKYSECVGGCIDTHSIKLAFDNFSVERSSKSKPHLGPKKASANLHIEENEQTCSGTYVCREIASNYQGGKEPDVGKTS